MATGAQEGETVLLPAADVKTELEADEKRKEGQGQGQELVKQIDAPAHGPVEKEEAVAEEGQTQEAQQAEAQEAEQEKKEASLEAVELDQAALLLTDIDGQREEKEEQAEGEMEDLQTGKKHGDPVCGKAEHDGAPAQTRSVGLVAAVLVAAPLAECWPPLEELEEGRKTLEEQVQSVGWTLVWVDHVDSFR